MKEAVFNSEVVKSLRSADFWAYKIADSPASWTASITRFTPEKPADIIACTKSGRFLLIECKQFKKWQGLYQTAFRDYQIKSLDAIVDQKGRAYAFINIRIKEERINYCVIVDWSKHRERIKSEGFTIKDMRERRFGIWIKGYKGEFDLSRWLP